MATAWDSALRYLGQRAHSRQELIQKLTRRGYDQEEIDQTLMRLDQADLLDDAQFARDYTRSLLSSRGSSRREVQRELGKKGISSDLVADVLADLPDDFDRALAGARKKMAGLADREKDVRWRRTLAYLARRGFSESTCYAAVRAAEEELNGN